MKSSAKRVNSSSRTSMSVSAVFASTVSTDCVM
jgi:hypothetical protein